MNTADLDNLILEFPPDMPNRQEKFMVAFNTLRERQVCEYFFSEIAESLRATASHLTKEIVKAAFEDNQDKVLEYLENALILKAESVRRMRHIRKDS